MLINVTGGLNLAAIILMLMGTQWYILFNVIAGASAIPQDLDYTTRLLQVKGWERWRTLILPALFPYLITGMITAGRRRVERQHRGRVRQLWRADASRRSASARSSPKRRPAAITRCCSAQRSRSS